MSRAALVCRLARNAPLPASCSPLPQSIIYQTLRFAAKKVSKPDRPRNESIKFRVVRLVDPETEKLGPPIVLKDLLAEIQGDKQRRKTQYVELVSETPEPIVKIMDKAAEYQRKKEVQKKKKLTTRITQTKEIQMTWGVASGDWAHKLRNAREALEQRHRVSIVYAPKKGQTLPTPEEMEQKIQETIATLADVSSEWRAPQRKGDTVVINLQSTVKAEDA